MVEVSAAASNASDYEPISHSLSSGRRLGREVAGTPSDRTLRYREIRTESSHVVKFAQGVLTQ